MSEPTPATDLKEYLRAGREDIRARHVAGALGGQVATALTDLNDRVVIEAYQRAMQQATGMTRAHLLEDLALVAVGGTGRGDTAPYSDVDLLFLRSKRAGSDVQNLINALVRNLWDYGMKLSQSVRTPQDTIDFPRQDLPMRTS